MFKLLYEKQKLYSSSAVSVPSIMLTRFYYSKPSLLSIPSPSANPDQLVPLPIQSKQQITILLLWNLPSQTKQAIRLTAMG